MKFSYGKQDWKTLERGEENCYLMTNGLGGFSSLSVIGSCSRNDQAVLMACLKAPNHRYNMIHRLEEQLQYGDNTCFLSSQDYVQKDRREEGFRMQEGFSFEDHPVWNYRVCGVEIVRSIVLAQGENTAVILYEMRNETGKQVSLTVTPHLQFVPKGTLMPADQVFSFEMGKAQGDFVTESCARIISGDKCLYLHTNGILAEVPLQICEDLYYADDEKDGRNFKGRTAVDHQVTITAMPGQSETLRLLYSTEPIRQNIRDGKMEVCRKVEELLEESREYRRKLSEGAGFISEPARTLAVSADQFLSRRESTGEWTILAGYPFFEDWGRDTMIALQGCCLATGQYEKARSILRSFARYCKKGLLPNLFPEGCEEPGYNTVDASLLFILAVWEYHRRTADTNFAAELFPVMSDIVYWYAKGTDYGIRMDGDGLLTAGGGYDQVTWMDVRIGDILPTPRHGKPVEINACWYNALRIMEQFAGMKEMEQLRRERAMEYGLMADRVKERFEAAFWNEKTGCLKDVLCGGPAEEQIRCNQIWVVSLPYALLSPDKERRVVKTVYERLYTPWGLRTLDPADEQYHGFYGGPQKERDLAYHQGTIWVFPLGAYYRAYLKVNGYSEEAKKTVADQLRLLEPALEEGCIGQLAEIYDGDDPVSSKGCFAQAWSVGEILRVYEALEK